MMAACPQPSSSCEPLAETKFTFVALTVAGQPVSVDVGEKPPLIGFVKSGSSSRTSCMKNQVFPLSSDSAARRPSSMSFGRQSKRPMMGGAPPKAFPAVVLAELYTSGKYAGVSGTKGSDVPESGEVSNLAPVTWVIRVGAPPSWG